MDVQFVDCSLLILVVILFVQKKTFQGFLHGMLWHNKNQTSQPFLHQRSLSPAGPTICKLTTPP